MAVRPPPPRNAAAPRPPIGPPRSAASAGRGPASRKLVIALSTQRSMPRASLTTGDARGRQRVQQPQPQRHLLEAAGRDRAHQRHARQRRRARPGHRPRSPPMREAAGPGSRPARRSGRAARSASPQPRAVPALGPAAQDEDVRRRHRRRTGPAGRARARPAVKVRPLSRQVTMTRAGLNSIGSIL